MRGRGGEEPDSEETLSVLSPFSSRRSKAASLGSAVSVSLSGGARLRENAAVLLEVAPLQHLDVMLVYLEGGAESDGQACQYVAALHQEKRLPVDFLRKIRRKDRNRI